MGVWLFYASLITDYGLRITDYGLRVGRLNAALNMIV
jgi:hypothetical protein